jgi:hypothetical protein
MVDTEGYRQSIPRQPVQQGLQTWKTINKSTKALMALAATDLPVCAFRFGWATVMRYMSIIMVMAPGRLCLSASRGFRPEPSPVVDVDVDVESPVGVELGGSGVHGVA